MKFFLKQFREPRLLILPLVWTLAIVILFLWMMDREWQHELKRAHRQLQTKLKKDMQFHKWNASVGGIYIAGNQVTGQHDFPSAAVVRHPESKPETLVYLQPQDMTGILNYDTGERSHLRKYHPRPDSLHPDFRPDNWENLALQILATERLSFVSDEIKTDTGYHLRMMLPIYSTKEFRKFHDPKKLTDSALWGGLSMRQSLKSHLNDFHTLRATIGGSLAFVWFIGLLGILISQRLVSAKISQQKELLAALGESEEKYRHLIDQSNDGIYLLFQDRFEVVNNAFIHLFGYSPEELAGTDFDFRQLVAPQSIPAIQERMAQIARGEKVTPLYEFTAVTKDGRQIECETSVSYFEYAGEIATQGIIRDISQRKNRENQLRQLAAVIDQASEAVIITDLEANIVYVNSAFEKLTGYASEEVIGRNPNLLQSGNHDRDFYAQMWQTLMGGKTFYGKMTNRRKDGSLFYEDAVIFPIIDSQGKTINYAGVKRDISSEKALTEQLRQSQKMEAVGRLAGGVAHDFNNLLTVINGYCELILARLHEQDSMREEVQMIAQAGERAGRLTTQLLAFSRRQILSPCTIQLNQIVTDLSRMLKRLIGEDLDFISVLAPDVKQVKADRGQVEQILLNLAVNARDAMPEGGKLTIETNNALIDEDYAARHISVSPGEYVCLSVSDTGIGMDAKTRARIFEPFFTTKESGHGTGLGLSTVYGIVKQSGGHIWVYSEVNKGTSFKIYLPALPDDAADETGQPVSMQKLEGTETILLVEDDASVQEITLQILKSHGYEVVTANNGAAALKILKSKHQNIDLLITDVVMPKMSGKELAKRAEKFQPKLKVIYISGYTDNAITHHRILKPGVHFVQKPFSTASLLSKVRQVLDKTA